MLAITPFLADRFPVFTMVASASLTERFVAWLAQLWQSFTEWAAQPRQSYRPGYLPTYFQARVYPLWERGLLALTKKSSADVVAAALAWLITFCVVCIIILGLGFGPAGVVAGMRLSLLTPKLFSCIVTTPIVMLTTDRIQVSSPRASRPTCTAASRPPVGSLPR